MEEHQACKRAPTRLTINYVYENIFSGYLLSRFTELR
jgi:hypothetical protein